MWVSKISTGACFTHGVCNSLQRLCLRKQRPAVFNVYLTVELVYVVYGLGRLNRYVRVPCLSSFCTKLLPSLPR